MALMFARLARNFIKNGYFPTDEATLERIAQMVQVSDTGSHRLLDPCCGEGSALADLRNALVQRHRADNGSEAVVEALGVEFDRERAWHAKQLLGRVIHSDLHDVMIKPRSIGLLLLNPPYGYGVSDAANRHTEQIDHTKAERLERTFLKKTVPLLTVGGVLIYIIPHYALDDDIRTYLARNFQDLRVFMAPERQFKQCVVIGRRVRAGHAVKSVLDLLTRAQASEGDTPILPTDWHDAPYVVPAIQPDQEFDFHAVRMDAAQLGDELVKYRSSLLWSQLEPHFAQARGNCRPPLRDLTPWHLALALAAGQIVGTIQSTNGRTFLIKGDTFKRKDRTVSVDVDAKGNPSQTVVMLDKFVPVINAIELTPDHRLGQIVRIA